MDACHHAAMPRSRIKVCAFTSSKKAGFEAAAQISVGTASLQEPAEALAGLGLGLSAWGQVSFDESSRNPATLDPV